MGSDGKPKKLCLFAPIREFPLPSRLKFAPRSSDCAGKSAAPLNPGEGTRPRSGAARRWVSGDLNHFRPDSLPRTSWGGSLVFGGAVDALLRQAQD
jgi:hypothetical protein